MKYGAKRTACEHGHTHDSMLEAGRCNDLHVLQDQGRIARLEQQPEFPVHVGGKLIFTYKADFAWFQGNCRIIEDVKGVKTPVYRLKKKLVEAYHPGTVITEWPVPKRKRRAKK